MTTDLILSDDEARNLLLRSCDWLSWELTARQTCDLELLLNGGFSPLSGFMTRGDYESVCERMRLSSGHLWPIPICLDVSETFASRMAPGSPVVLRDAEGAALAVITVEEIWKPDRMAEAEALYGTTNSANSHVRYLLHSTGAYYVSGRLEGIHLPEHYDFKPLRMTPKALRAKFRRLGWNRVIAFQPNGPMHRADQELTSRAAQIATANLLIQPVVGATEPGDLDYCTRIKCYQAIVPRYGKKDSALLSLLPLAKRMAGSREVLWEAIVRRNYGCTHLIVPGEGTGPEAQAAWEMLSKHQRELSIALVSLSDSDAPNDARVIQMSDGELRELLAAGKEIPEFFTFKEVADELRRAYPPRIRRGFAVFFTGLSGSGKSTVANILRIKLLGAGGRSVTLLDGDIVRKHLSSELGFSRAHRDINILRIGYVASEITKAGGVCICAPIAPYDAARKKVRHMVSAAGGFLLVHMSTAIEVCEARDRKGLYAKARAGLIETFTGISDPYEPPFDADIVIDAASVTAQHGADMIVDRLGAEGYLPSPNVAETRGAGGRR
ncbi:MAG TPA: bifunctional sulfate adenylyltransferase/adenylylsulfate kinase [Terriglobia bacterium]|nr:bifunctional sulfate adenylyltransferase/adenylylsulfate kinase [Terriglobia bacterium]